MAKENEEYIFPKIEGIEGASPEEAAAAQMILFVMEEFYKMGLRQVTRRELLEALGCEVVLPDDDNVTIVLSEKYFEKKEKVLELLRSKMN